MAHFTPSLLLFCLPFLLLFSTYLYPAHSVSIPRACSTQNTSTFPFCNTSLSLDARVRDLISRLNASEIPPLLTARMSPKGNVSRLGLPEYDWGANCVHGVQSRCGTRCPTSFPNPNALGATFNMSAVQQMASIIGVELRSLWLQGVGENHVDNLPHLGLDCWSPNININRDPRWGRNQEVPGEDPFLSGLFGAAYTRGLQEGEDPRYLQAVVTLKHFAAYSLEDFGGFNRHNFSAQVSKYDLATTYLPAFREAVLNGNAKGVMCSYNAINGVPACADTKFLRDILRESWGFDGYIVSDSGAVEDIYENHHYVATAEEAAADAISAGTDVNSGNVYLDSLLTALSKGLVNETVINNALYNSLKMRFELGLFDPIDDQPYWNVPPDAVNTNDSQAFNLLVTQQSMVLLQNPNDDLLPFPKDKKIAVIGPNANASQALVGNYLGQICPDRFESYDCVKSPFQAISQLNGGDTSLALGCSSVLCNTSTGFEQACDLADESDLVVLIIGTDQSIEGESHDRTNTTLPGLQMELVDMILQLNKPTAVVLINGGSLSVDKLKQSNVAIIEAFFPGFRGAEAIASVLFGDYNPGGKLPVTIYPQEYIDEVDMLNMSMTKSPGRSYRYYTGDVLWPFGYGLSYTTFNLSWTVEDSYTLNNTVSNSSLQFEVVVENTGKLQGDEVVQVYFAPVNVSTSTPLIKQLVYFERVTLQASESKTVSFQVDCDALKLGTTSGDLVSATGSYHLMVTNGVLSDPLTTSITVVGTANAQLVPFPIPST